MPEKSPKTPVKLYIAFADADRRSRDELLRQLQVPIASGKIMVWHRDMIAPGAEILPEMQRQLREAHIIVLLISSNLLAERTDEVKDALNRRGVGSDVIPVLLRPAFMGGSPLEDLNKLPDNDTFISKRSDRDEAWVEVVIGLSKLIDTLYKKFNPPPLPSDAKIILFLPANPWELSSISLGKEFEAVEKCLAASPNTAHLTVQRDWAASNGDLIGMTRKYKPTILHFSGHGARSGNIILENEEGRKVAVPVGALTRMFHALDSRVRCVVLNSCFSKVQAEGLLAEVDCVLGIEGEVPDLTAIAFSKGFYSALGHGRSVAQAVEEARAQAALTGQEMEDILKLITRPDVSASDIRFV